MTASMTLAWPSDAEIEEVRATLPMFLTHKRASMILTALAPAIAVREARARDAAIEECAAAAAMARMPMSEWKSWMMGFMEAREVIAAAIRALKGRPA